MNFKKEFKKYMVFVCFLGLVAISVFVIMLGFGGGASYPNLPSGESMLVALLLFALVAVWVCVTLIFFLRTLFHLLIKQDIVWEKIKEDGASKDLYNIKWVRWTVHVAFVVVTCFFINLIRELI